MNEETEGERTPWWEQDGSPGGPVQVSDRGEKDNSKHSVSHPVGTHQMKKGAGRGQQLSKEEWEARRRKVHVDMEAIRQAEGKRFADLEVGKGGIGPPPQDSSPL